MSEKITIRRKIRGEPREVELNDIREFRPADIVPSAPFRDLLYLGRINENEIEKLVFVGRGYIRKKDYLGRIRIPRESLFIERGKLMWRNSNEMNISSHEIGTPSYTLIDGALRDVGM